MASFIAGTCSVTCAGFFWFNVQPESQGLSSFFKQVLKFFWVFPLSPHPVTELCTCGQSCRVPYVISQSRSQSAISHGHMGRVTPPEQVSGAAYPRSVTRRLLVQKCRTTHSRGMNCWMGFRCYHEQLHGMSHKPRKSFRSSFRDHLQIIFLSPSNRSVKASVLKFCMEKRQSTVVTFSTSNNPCPTRVSSISCLRMLFILLNCFLFAVMSC